MVDYNERVLEHLKAWTEMKSAMEICRALRIYGDHLVTQISRCTTKSEYQDRKGAGAMLKPL